DEAEGYANLADFYAPVAEASSYDYHELNKYYGFKYLVRNKYKNVLGFGSAYGEEFLPIIDKLDRLTILDPSDKFVRDKVYGVPAKYIKPSSDGVLPFADENFDLITCLGVLHHIPNVTFVMGEIYRCLEKNGIALIREPNFSMGDWTKPRQGLTKRERGLPVKYMDETIEKWGFKIVSKYLCMFPLIPKICNKLGIVTYNNKALTQLDRLASIISAKNIRYHRTNILQ
ncbi:class I SAM-dependent methyltransferase, partial [Anaplasma marginale]|uniref:class I SAM-dependent methyltransferase n=1 Tax=Anaplasma marginale TaxID=770 RepID=UPI0005B422AD